MAFPQTSSPSICFHLLGKGFSRASLVPRAMLGTGRNVQLSWACLVNTDRNPQEERAWGVRDWECPCASACRAEQRGPLSLSMPGCLACYDILVLYGCEVETHPGNLHPCLSGTEALPLSSAQAAAPSTFKMLRRGFSVLHGNLDSNLRPINKPLLWIYGIYPSRQTLARSVYPPQSGFFLLSRSRRHLLLLPALPPTSLGNNSPLFFGKAILCGSGGADLTSYHTGRVPVLLLAH